MYADTTVKVGQYVIIDTGNKYDPEYGEVYRKATAGAGQSTWTFIIDMAEAGIKGDKGDTGATGP